MMLRWRTVRMRLTVLYSALFVLSAVVLLLIANSLGAHHVSAAGTGSGVSGATAPYGIGHPPPGTASPAYSPSSVAHQYLVGSAIALGVMTTATRRISASNLHERLAIDGPADELKDLSDTIDALLERLDGAFAAQRRFVANAAHELRTPLATMRVSVDVAVAKPGPVPPQTITLADQVRAELDKVDQLLDGLLVLARAQHGALPGHAMLRLDSVVLAALTAREDAITAKSLTVQHHVDSHGTWVEGSQPLLRRMADNLIGNAIVHNRDGGWIRITTRTGNGMALLAIENGGDILDPAQVADLGQPFRRLGADRTGSDDGTGLGLSIVAAIAEAHGGSLDLHARPGGGLTVKVTLPLAAPRATAVAAGRAGVPA